MPLHRPAGDHSSPRARCDTLKTPYRDGTTHVVFEPLDFIAHLAALVPRPRAYLTIPRLFAPHSRWRASDQASFITGETLRIDGGMLAGVS